MIGALIISFAAYILGLVGNSLFFNKNPASRVALVFSLALVYVVIFVLLMVIFSSGLFVWHSDIGKSAGIYASGFVIMLYLSIKKKNDQQHIIERVSDDNADNQILTTDLMKKTSVDETFKLSDKDEQAIYELITDELSNQNMLEWLWTKSLAESNGDLNSAKAIYIKYRYIQIKNDNSQSSLNHEAITNQERPLITMPPGSSQLSHGKDAKSFTKNAARSESDKLLEGNIIVPIAIVVFVVVLLVLINIF